MSHPLISSRTFSGLSDGIRMAVGNTDFFRTFEKAELPAAALVTKRAYISQLGQLQFFELIARKLGEPEMALSFAPYASITEYGVFGEYVTSRNTFGEALHLTAAMMQYHSSLDRLSIEKNFDEVAFCYHAALTNAIGYRHYATLAISVMRTLATHYFGTPNVARRIEFNFSKPGNASAFEDRFCCPVRFDQPRLCLIYDVDQLNQNRTYPPPRIVTLSEVVHDAIAPAPRDTVGAVEALIRLGIYSSDTGMDRVAHQLQLGERTVRRRLAAAGTTYREMVLKSKMRRARELLSETKLPITRIATQLGYSDPSHFGRAFRKFTGLSPREARSTKIVLAGNG